MLDHANAEAAVGALMRGAAAYFEKPPNLDIISVVVRSALKQQALLLDHQSLVEGIQRSNAELKREIAERKRVEKQLRQAMVEIKTLSGLLPICASCKKLK